MNPDIKKLLRQFFPLLVAIALQQLIALTVNLVDNFMLGSYSETAMSGAAIVNQLQFMLQSLVGGCGAGITVLGAQYWGKKQVDPIKKIISVGLRFSLAAGIIFTTVTALWPTQVLSLFTDDAAILAQGASYLRVICWTYLIFSISTTLVASLQSVQTAFIGTLMSAITVCINATLNYLLIFGNFGCPELGVQGAAFATLTSRSVELIVITVYILFIDKKLRMRLIDLWHFGREYLKDYLHVALPVMITGGLWGVAQAAQTAVIGHMSAEALAANSIASVIFQLFTCFGFSCANASAVITGKTIGSGRSDLVKPLSRTFQVLFVCFGVVSGLALLACINPIMSIYNVSPETHNLSVNFLIVLGITMMFSIYEYPVESGIIAGGGDTKYAAIVDNSFMWLWTIPMSALSAFIFGWDPIVTFWILKSDQILKCIPNFIRCNRYKWVKNLTR